MSEVNSGQPVVIKVTESGPLRVKGPVTLVDAEGTPYDGLRKTLFLCRCGASKSKPFCDGSHVRVGFTAPITTASQSEGAEGEGSAAPIRRMWPPAVASRTPPGHRHPAYAQVVEVTRPAGDRAIHVAGTLATDSGRNLLGAGDIGRQTAVALDNVRASLDAVGATIGDIVRVRVYVTDMETFKRDGAPAYVAFFSGVPTSSTVVQVGALAHPEAMVEVEVEAHLGPG